MARICSVVRTKPREGFILDQDGAVIGMGIVIIAEGCVDTCQLQQGWEIDQSRPLTEMHYKTTIPCDDPQNLEPEASIRSQGGVGGLLKAGGSEMRTLGHSKHGVGEADKAATK